MIRLAMVTMGTVLLAAAAQADDTKAHRKQIELVADAITSAQSCSQLGYLVDFDGIVAWREQTAMAATQSGMDASDVARRQQDSIDRKYAWLRKKSRFAGEMVAESNARWRHQRFWAKRCKKLSESEDTARFFKPMDT